MSIVECFKLIELVECNSVDWCFFSALASDVDTNKIINIIKKMVEEEKRKINSVLVKEDDVVIKKEFSQEGF
ncbi:hypothetical protein [Pantoea agglomerans]|uniref:hypothetical protein n=1 Tax=Enterobacter agglomerans TaxID=549 RepID=UPI003C7DE506